MVQNDSILKIFSFVQHVSQGCSAKKGVGSGNASKK